MSYPIVEIYLSNCNTFHRNNHLRQHRQALRDAVATIKPPVRLLALNWSLDKPQSTIHRVCCDRVLSRGENHQTLRADALAKSHEEVIWQFITKSEELSGNEVDDTIDMDLEETLEQAVNRAVDGCVRVLGLPRPGEEKVKEALDVARGYAPKVKKADDQKKKAASPRYFGLLAEVDLLDILEKPLSSREAWNSFWKKLTDKKRVAPRPHVTIVHKNSLPGEKDLWERCMALHMMAVPPLFKFELGEAVWNDRIMALTVENLELESVGDSVGQEGQEFISKLSQDVRQRLHITVGTMDQSIPPVEAKALVEAWRQGKMKENAHSLDLQGIVVKGRIKGMFQ